MSLRRSARVASSSAPASLDAKARSGIAKYEKVGKASATAKKRKTTKAPAPISPDAIKSESTTNGPETSGLANVASSLPSTPLPKKRKPASKSTSEAESPLKPPPFTPTPAGASIFSSAPSFSPSDHTTRLADPHTTNANLATPNGSHVVQAYASSPAKPTDPPPAKKRKAKEVVPPDVGTIPPASTDIDNLLKDAEEFLIKTDPKLETVVKGHKCEIFSPDGLREVVRPFESLGKGIIGQQVSGQAAASIRAKFTALFPDTRPSFPSPAQVLAKDVPTLRTAGLSQRKAEYIYGIAEKFASGELSAEMLVSASDEELIEKLVAVRGLGRWSVEMFACFGLKRMDVFSTGDLGVQRGMAVYAGRDVNKLKNKGGKWKYMTEQEMLDMASKFKPYSFVLVWPRDEVDPPESSDSIDN
ncbi:DNA-3-methyladenine glycosylase II [Alternaria panax]|uniref:DNA-3-methyladenine glycosylase II n=1 Tax=Alternaria panax TaxID=48097 RepID=A0AAD4FIU0_9PLEO|nr:DNA-3-methyladenine glycosylase II [Alternaria panax]